MFLQNDIERGGPILTAPDPSKVYEGYEILDSFHEQHMVDLEYTVLTVFLFHFVLTCQSEAACRQVIGHFLNNAMRAAAKYYHLASGAVFHEYTISHPNLLGIGYISGPVDYLVASTVGNMRPLETGGAAVPGSRRFLVVEAKQGATLTLAVSMSQLFAQLLTVQNDDPFNPFLLDVLTISERLEHAGVLTDGSNWRFFLFSRKEKGILLHSSGNITAGDKILCNKVLGNSPRRSEILTTLIKVC